MKLKSEWNLSRLLIFSCLSRWFIVCESRADPFSFAAGVSSIFLDLYYKIENPLCLYTECCNDNWIKPNLTGLQSALKSKLHGQHLVGDNLIPILKAHVLRENPSKPLVLSFHGWTGVGKNFVSHLIVDHLYKLGYRSRYVTVFLGTADFPIAEDVNEYKKFLRNAIKSKVSSCPQSLFIFDEVDDFPEQLMDVVSPFLGSSKSIEGVDYRKCIFIFLSNVGGRFINEVILKFWKDGSMREKIALKDFEREIHLEAFNKKGGFIKSKVIAKGMIDYYIPFLPLERKHVKLCARDKSLEEKLEPTEEMLEWVTDQLSFTPDDSRLFSLYGCKKVEQYVLLWIEKNFHFDRDL